MPLQLQDQIVRGLLQTCYTASDDYIGSNYCKPGKAAGVENKHERSKMDVKKSRDLARIWTQDLLNSSQTLLITNWATAWLAAECKIPVPSGTLVQTSCSLGDLNIYLNYQAYNNYIDPNYNLYIHAPVRPWLARTARRALATAVNLSCMHIASQFSPTITSIVKWSSN